MRWDWSYVQRFPKVQTFAGWKYLYPYTAITVKFPFIFLIFFFYIFYFTYRKIRRIFILLDTFNDLVYKLCILKSENGSIYINFGYISTRIKVILQSRKQESKNQIHYCKSLKVYADPVGNELWKSNLKIKREYSKFNHAICRPHFYQKHHFHQRPTQKSAVKIHL